MHKTHKQAHTQTQIRMSAYQKALPPLELLHSTTKAAKISSKRPLLGASTNVDLVHTLSKLLGEKYTFQHMHASPRSNHREHTPCPRSDTHSHTCMHRLAAITVSMCLVHKNTQTSTRMHSLAAITVTMRLVQALSHTPTYACIASQPLQ